MLSTREAAGKLGVSVRRVTKLISEGRLVAEKRSGVWLVDDDSVEAFAALGVSKKGGRPCVGFGKSERLFTLMNRQHPVALLVHNSDLGLFTVVKEVLDARRLPLGVTERGTINMRHLNGWWKARGLSENRPDLAQLLVGYSANSPDELLMRGLGLSLSDHYWLNPHGSNLDWHDVNFFENGFPDGPSDCDTTGFRLHPDLTTDGKLSKHWMVKGDTRWLFKSGGPLNQEPYNEVVATALYEVLLQRGAYVAYRLARWGGSTVCKCESFLSDEEEWVSAESVLRAFEKPDHRSVFEHYLAVCEQLGARGARRALNEMIVCDYVLANTERTWRNFGLVRNVETQSWRVAPLFDTGTCLWSSVGEESFSRDALSYQTMPFCERPGGQLNLVDDFSWVDVDALRAFPLTARGILAQNSALAPRLQLLMEDLSERIERVAAIVAAFA